MTVETRGPSADLTYSIHDFEAGTHRDSLFLYQAIEDAMVDLATELRGGRVLDVACGTGKIAMRLDQRGCSSVGCEASTEMIGVGRYVHPESRAMIVRSIAETLPFGDASFDRVLCQGSLDHFADANAFMRESARVVKPAGRVVIALANFESLSCKLGRTADRIKRRLGRPRPPWRPYWIIPEDHNVKGDMSFVRALGGDFLELDRVRGISLLWLFSRYGQALDALPQPVARGVWRSLDAIARMRPELSDMIISVWRKPGARPTPER
jgi:SAM-dependent methyltransferase